MAPMGGQARDLALDDAEAELNGSWSYFHAVESWPEKTSSNQANHGRQQHYQQDGGAKGPHSSTPFELDSQENISASSRSLSWPRSSARELAEPVQVMPTSA